MSGVSFFLGNNQPTAVDVARHAAYVADLVGVQHAGVGLDISFRQPELDDNPPDNYDPSYWWPSSAGYNRSVHPSTYTPIDSWQVLGQALQNTGMTAAIDRDGRVLARLPQYQEGRLDVEVSGYSGATPFVRYGNGLALAAAAVLLALSAALRKR